MKDNITQEMIFAKASEYDDSIFDGIYEDLDDGQKIICKLFRAAMELSDDGICSICNLPYEECICIECPVCGWIIGSEYCWHDEHGNCKYCGHKDEECTCQIKYIPASEDEECSVQNVEKT